MLQNVLSSYDKVNKHEVFCMTVDCCDEWTSQKLLLTMQCKSAVYFHTSPWIINNSCIQWVTGSYTHLYKSLLLMSQNPIFFLLLQLTLHTTYIYLHSLDPSSAALSDNPGR